MSKKDDDKDEKKRVPVDFNSPKEPEDEKSQEPAR